MTILFKRSPLAVEWLQQTLMSVVWPELPNTAAEAMCGEMPADWIELDNWAAGPTEREVWWRECGDGAC